MDGLTYEDLELEGPGADPERARRILLRANAKLKRRKHSGGYKPVPRLSRREREAARKLRLKCDKESRKKNIRLLKGLGVDASLHPIELFKTLAARKDKFSLGSHRRRRLKSILPAYGLWWDLRHSLEPALTVQGLKQNLSNRVSDEVGDFLPWLLQITVDYIIIGDDGKHVLDKRALSRDAQAIRWLWLREIPPWQVLDKQRDHGGGLDQWSRLMAAANRKGGGEHEVQAQPSPKRPENVEVEVGSNSPAKEDASNEEVRRAKSEEVVDDGDADAGGGFQWSELPKEPLLAANPLGFGDLRVDFLLGRRRGAPERVESVIICLDGPFGKRRKQIEKMVELLRASAIKAH